MLRNVYRPDSHDSSDSVDDALESSRQGVRAVKISLVVLAVTAVLQVLVVVVSGSVALRADTIHNLSDALTALPLWVAFVLGRRAATGRYTYGFGRAEDLAGLFVVAMIAVSAGLAGWEALRRLVDPQPVSNLGWVAVAGVVGFLGNETVALYRNRIGRQIGSAALVADGLHARTDGLTSLAVVAGAVGIALGWQRADPVVGLIITVAILVVLRSAAVQIYRRLMDAVDPELVTQATAVVRAVPGVQNIRELRIRWIGHTLRAEVDAVVDPHLNLTSAHDITHHAETHLLRQVPRLTAATVHTSPAGAHAPA